MFIIYLSEVIFMTRTTADFKQQMKKYLFYGLSLLVIITMVVLIAVFASAGKEEVSAPVNSNAAIVFTSPILNAEISKNYSGTELQWNETLKQWEAHKAVDFKAQDNAKVYAAFNGKVAEITSNALVGTQITIEHDAGLKTVYSMLSPDTTVKVGDSVKTGDQIGVVTLATGIEEKDGAHLHFEVWKEGSKVDPSGYLNLEGK